MPAITIAQCCVRPELTPDLVDQVRDVVADTAGAVRTQVGEVLANLRGVDPRGLRELLGRDRRRCRWRRRRPGLAGRPGGARRWPRGSSAPSPRGEPRLWIGLHGFVAYRLPRAVHKLTSEANAHAGRCADRGRERLGLHLDLEPLLAVDRHDRDADAVLEFQACRPPRRSRPRTRTVCGRARPRSPHAPRRTGGIRDANTAARASGDATVPAMREGDQEDLQLHRRLARRRPWSVRRPLPALLAARLRPGLPHHRSADPGPGRGPRGLPGAVAGAGGLRCRPWSVPHVLPVAGPPPSGRYGPARGAAAQATGAGIEPRERRRRRRSGRRGRRGGHRGSAPRDPCGSRNASTGTTTGPRVGVFPRDDPGADRRAHPDPARAPSRHEPSPRCARCGANWNGRKTREAGVPDRPRDDRRAAGRLRAGWPHRRRRRRWPIGSSPITSPRAWHAASTLTAFRDVTADLALSVDPLTPPETLLPRLHRELEPRRGRRRPMQVLAVAAGVVAVVGLAGLTISQGMRASNANATAEDLQAAAAIALRPDADLVPVGPVHEVSAPGMSEFYVIGTAAREPPRGLGLSPLVGRRRRRPRSSPTSGPRTAR